MSTDAVVYVVDDDQALCQAMELLLRSVGLRCRIFHSGQVFLDALPANAAGCIVLDIRMPGIGGLEIQDNLVERGQGLPIIFATGYADVPMAAAAGSDWISSSPPS